MANLKRVNDPDPELTAARRLMSRRDTITGAAKLVAGLCIGTQVMAATGAETALAKNVRDVARRAGQTGLRHAHQPHRRNVAAGGLPLRPLR